MSSLKMSSMIMTIMGIPLQVNYEFFDEALEWYITGETIDIDQQKLLELLLRLHHSDFIETTIRNHRYWQDYHQANVPTDLNPEDIPF